MPAPPHTHPRVAPGVRPRPATIGLVLPVLLAALLTYVNTLPNGFVYDDEFLVVKNSVLRDPAGLLHPPTWFRHLKTLTLALDYTLWKLRPAGYHATNAILHAAAGALLTLLAAELSRSRTVALAAGLLFVVHPVHSEAVAAISNRGDPLASVFVFAGLLALLRAKRRALGWAAFFAAVLLASFSKETIGAAGILMAVLVVTTFDEGSVRARLRNSLPAIGAMAAGLGAAAVVFPGKVAAAFSGENVSALTHGETTRFWDLLLTEVSALATYAGLIFRTVGLCIFHPLAIVRSPWNASFIVGLAVLAAVAGLATACRRRSRLVAFGAAWFGLGLLPVLNLVPVNQYLVAERYLYFPLAGLCLAAGWAAARIYGRIGAGRNGAFKAGAVALAVAVPCLLAAGAIHRNNAWLDSISLWSDTVRQVPESAHARNGFGAALYDAGFTRRAAGEFQQAVRLDPAYAKALDNLAHCYADLGEHLGEAEELARRALVADPGHFHALATLAEVAFRQGDVDKSMALVSEAIRLDRGRRSLDSFKHFNQEYEEQLARYRAAAGRRGPTSR